MKSIRCKKRILGTEPPLIMGILNLTPDSFYDGNRYTQEVNMLFQVEKMLNHGADIIDIGAFSSRPGAEFVTENEERKRLIFPIKRILQEFPDTIISVDTYRSSIAEEVVSEGVEMINDISSGNLDRKMFQTIAKLQVPYVMMHMQGTPIDMQKNPVYENVVTEINSFFKDKINQLKSLGIQNIILDPGFGFGKTIKHNYTILKHLSAFKEHQKPILVGVSRKSMLYKLLEIDSEKALNATSIANTIAVLNGANILRVHDIKEAKEVIKITQELESSI